MNTNNDIKKAVIAFILLLAPGITMAEPTVGMNIGARHQFTTWEGSNNSTGSKFDATASMVGVDFTLRYADFYGGVSLLGGSFEFKGNAPDRPTKGNPVSASTTIRRTEFNLIGGYYIIPQLSVFIDLQNIKNDWKGEDYTVEYNGFGLGLSGHHQIAPHWIIYGSIGIVPLKIEQPKNTEIGDGRGGSLEIGGSYILKDNMTISLSLKSQSREFDYTTAPDQTHDVGGLLARFNYTFR